MMLLPATRAVARRPLVSVPCALRQRHLHLHHAPPRTGSSLRPTQHQRPAANHPARRTGLAIRTYALGHDTDRAAPVESLADVGQVLRDADWMLRRLEPPPPGGTMMYRVKSLSEDPLHALEQAYVALGALAGSLARSARIFSKHEWSDRLSGASQAFKEVLEKQTAELKEFGEEHAKYTERLAAAKSLKTRAESAKRWLESEKGNQTRLEERATRERGLMESRIDSLEQKIKEGEEHIRLARARKNGHTLLAPVANLIPLLGSFNSATEAGFQDEITALRAKRDIFHDALTRNYNTDDSEAHKQYLASRTLSDIGRLAESLVSKVERLEAAMGAGRAELDGILASKAAVARIFDQYLGDMVAATGVFAQQPRDGDFAASILQILLLTPDRPAKLWIEAEKVCEIVGRLPEEVLGGGGAADGDDYGRDEPSPGELLRKVQALVKEKVATDEVRKWKRMDSGWGRRAFRRGR